MDDSTAATTPHGIMMQHERGDEHVASLVGQAQGGSLEAFEQLYRRFHRQVYGISLRMAGVQDLAEEMVQETFLRAWHGLSRFRAESGFGTWLYRLAANTACQLLRSRGRILESCVASEDLDALSTRAANESGAESRLMLDEALASLPFGARQVILLRDVEGFSYSEISEMTGLALGTVKAQVHRGRRLLMVRMQP
jgi:RNA polymerase sigma-70 factor, ECF subfamily